MKSLNNIRKMVDNLKKQMEANLPLITSEIDSIIENKVTSIRDIEHLLDTLLDYLQLGVGDAEFKRLNAYYASFNKENADEYDKLYKNLFEEE